MGKVYSSLIKRPLRNWNVEHRAAEVISLTKPKPAPRHVSDASAPSTSTPNAGLSSIETAVTLIPVIVQL